MALRRSAALLASALLLLSGLALPPAVGALGDWAPVASPNVGRGAYVTGATPLQDGQVLITISDLSGTGEPPRGTLAAYDPATDRWAERGPFPMLQGHEAPALLPDGRVLFTGGAAARDSAGGLATNAAQLYDAATNTWSPVAPMANPRMGHRATVLQDGTVLVVGGLASDRPSQGSDPGESIGVPGAERYDPQTNRWLPAGRLATPRTAHTATLLRDGRVLVVGGSEPRGSTAHPELYDPAANAWTAAGTAAGRWTFGHTATLLPDGRVLVAGGSFYSFVPILADTGLYDPATNAWTSAAPMTTGRSGHTATLLPDGRVLVAGGFCCAFYTPDPLASTELYDPIRNVWAGAAPMSARRGYHTATPLPGGGVFVVGMAFGEEGNSSSPRHTAEVYRSAPDPGACFAETGRCVRGPFLAYWQAHGDLAVNGFPISDEFIEVLEDGRAYQVQYFERVRMEYHPENPPPYDVLLGQFGRRILLEEYVVARENYPYAIAPTAAQPGQTFFPETGHNISPLFLDYWQANGGLAQFGYPITEERWDTLLTGANACCRTQYFERARFEYHPENAGTPYTILLGQFGRRILDENALLTGPTGQLFASNEQVRGQLGRPTGPAIASDGAAQAFEHGLMLYEGAGRRIFVLCGDPQAGTLIPSGQYPNERQFPAFADTWQEGDDPGGGAGPTAGLFLPRRGFGKVWRENPESVKACVGYATTPGETGYRIVTQQFAGGFILTDPRGDIYVIPTLFGKCCGLGGSYQRYAAPVR